MLPLISVMLGGAVGAGVRHLAGVAILSGTGPGFPWGTLTVNLVGGLAMGVLTGTLARIGGGETWRLLLGVGVLGGFTTFSAFGLESWTMVARGDWMLAIVYALSSVMGAVALTGVGIAIARTL